jgi:hypothetical protein
MLGIPEGRAVGKLFAAELHRRKKGFMTFLRRRMTEDMQVRGLSPQTQAYSQTNYTSFLAARVRRASAGIGH